LSREEGERVAKKGEGKVGPFPMPSARTYKQRLRGEKEEKKINYSSLSLITHRVVRGTFGRERIGRVLLFSSSSTS